MRLTGRVAALPPVERGFHRLKEALGMEFCEVRPPAHKGESRLAVVSLVRPHRVKMPSYKQEWNRGIYRLRWIFVRRRLFMFLKGENQIV